MARCFVTRSLPGNALDRLAEAHEVDVWEGELPPPREEILSRARYAEGLICLLTDRIDAQLLDECPSLRAISNLAVGTDNIDLAEAARLSIAVGNTPQVLTETTADLAFALILAAARGLLDAAGAVRAGEWQTWEPARWLGHDVHGATLGIVGPGAIGSAVARRGDGFGMEILLNGRGPAPGRVPLAEILERADVISLHAPLTPETHHLIGADELRR